MYLLHLRRCALFNSEVLLVNHVLYLLCLVPTMWCVFWPLLLPFHIVRLLWITLYYIAFGLHSTLAFRLHCKTISGEVMLCCLLSSLGLQVFSTWILNCICGKFFVFFSICVWNQITFESDLMSCWWLQFYGLVALIGLLPWDPGVYVAVLKFQLLLIIVFRFVFVPATLC